MICRQRVEWPAIGIAAEFLTDTAGDCFSRLRQDPKVRDQHAISIVNMDPAMHDVQGYETSHLGPRVLFNVPLPISSKYPQEASAHAHKHYEGPAVIQPVHMTKGRRVYGKRADADHSNPREADLLNGILYEASWTPAENF